MKVLILAPAFGVNAQVQFWAETGRSCGSMGGGSQRYRLLGRLASFLNHGILGFDGQAKDRCLMACPAHRRLAEVPAVPWIETAY